MNATDISLQGYPLSPSQLDCWPRSIDAAIPSGELTLSIAGPLESGALERAIRRVVERHEILRTRFRLLPGMAVPLQVVDPVAGAAGLGTPVRFHCESGAGEHTLSIAAEALCADGPSLVRIAEEIAAALTGTLPESEPLQFLQFAEWQRSLENEAREEAESFWSTVPVSDLRKVAFGPPTKTERISRTLDIFTTAQLSTAAQELVAPPEDFLLACFEAWLSMLYGDQAPPVAIRVDHRHLEDLSDAVGPLSRYVQIPVNFDRSTSLATLLECVAEGRNGCRRHQDSAVAPATGHTVVFDYLEIPHPWTAGGLAFTISDIRLAPQACQLRIACTQSRGALRIAFDYDPQSYPVEEAERLLASFAASLGSAAAEPAGGPDRWQLLGEDDARTFERQSRYGTLSPTFSSCVEMIEDQARRAPLAVAVVHGMRRLTYSELLAESDRLAHTLNAHHAGPETTVAVCMERSVEVIAAILAVQRTGAAYVPMNPEYPNERLSFLIGNCGAGVILTQMHLAHRFAGIGVTVICVDGDLPVAKEHYRRSCGISPENLAYVIYTSGSTGEPKGVGVSHGNLMRSTVARSVYYQQKAGVFLLPSPVAFDSSVAGIFWTLCYGGTLAIPEERYQEDISGLLGLLERERASHLLCLPSLYDAILAVASRHQLASLRCVIVAGESCSQQLVSRHFECAPHARMFNEYGPTEGTVWATVHECTPADADRAVPIGIEIPGVAAYILNAVRRPLPAGLPGELYIGGNGVARGYLDRPGLTAERFLPDPFSSEPGARIYRTGDLVRRRTDGSIEFLGRADHQVKIRGVRIELEEIEQVLRRHPAVHDACVLARPAAEWDGGSAGAGGELRLAAYIVPNAEAAGPAKILHRLQRTSALRDRDIAVLPNGLPLASLNRNETEFLYREIFECRVYDRHGIDLSGSECIFDVGANIGMFSLFAHLANPAAKIYAFEPVPSVFRILDLNGQLHGIKGQRFPIGLSRSNRQATITHYPQLSLMSSLYTDIEGDREFVARFEREKSGTTLDAERVSEMVAMRLRPESIAVELRTLSSIIAELKLDRIDVLKIDVEKSEADVLEGIQDADWPKIGQIAMEVDAREGRLEWIAGLLERHGFQVEIIPSDVTQGAELFDVYATRPDRKRVAHPTVLKQYPVATPEGLATELRNWAEANLPMQMRPYGIFLMDQFPLNANGKVDRKLLPPPCELRRSLARKLKPPVTPLECALTEIWREVVGTAEIGVDDNFFEIGGDSIRGIILINRIQQLLGDEVRVVALLTAPTISKMVEYLETHYVTAVEAFHANRSQQVPALSPIRRRPRTPGARFPLSAPQQRLWFLCRLAPESPAYNITSVLSLRGTLDLDAFRQSVGQLVERHEVFRARFDEEQGEPYQTICEPAPVEVPLIDLSTLGRIEAEAEARRRVTLETSRAFDLTNGPLLRIELCKLGAQEHWAILSMHHIIADGWSIGVLVDDLNAFYSAHRAGREPALVPLPIQFADYAAWQSEHVVGGGSLEYWERQLSGAPSRLELPTGRTRPKQPSGRGARHSFDFDEPVVRQLEEFSRVRSNTLFVTAMAAFCALLSRLSRQVDFCVGSPVANRSRSELERLVGFFVNTLVLRFDLSDDPDFETLLERAGEIVAAAFNHQYVPFEKVVERLSDGRDPGYSPLFQVLFTLQDDPTRRLALDDVEVDRIEVADVPAKFDLSLNLIHSSGRLRGEIEFNTDLFDSAAMQVLANRYERMLAACLRTPSARVSELPLLLPEERNALITAAIGKQTNFLSHNTIHGSFADQARRTPDAVAVVLGDVRLTYAELECRASRLANRLRAFGIGTESPVCVVLERTPEVIVALLAILKAGGAYVPIDPDNPGGRVRFLVEDSRASLVLISQRLAPLVSDLPVAVMTLNSDTASLPVAQPSAPPAVGDPDALAYLIYTSGSTGMPKAVAVSHRSVLRLVSNTDVMRLGADEVILQSAPLAFDTSTLQIWGALLNGGRLVLMPDHTPGVSELEDLVREQRVTSMVLTASLFHAIAAHGGPGFAGVRQFMSGGEALAPDLAAAALRKFSRSSLINAYGPTECTTVATRYILTGDTVMPERIPIGRPIANTEAYLLDEHLQPVPPGTIGEICLGGAGLARGYLHRPGHTAEHFVPHPFAARPGVRLYRTGDYGRAQRNGEIEFLGRKDAQVKIRGFRVELGEVEKVLRASPMVRDAAVIVYDAPGGDSLAGYVVSPGEFSETACREWMRQRLPAYMVPSTFVVLDALPVTASGKIDRNALPAPTAVDRRRAGRAPETSLELALARIWSDLFGGESSADDNFFDRGGHSLLAMRLAARIEQELAVRIPLRAIFECPTIAGLAVWLDAQQARLSQSNTAIRFQVRPEERFEPFPLTEVQQAYWIGRQAGFDTSPVATHGYSEIESRGIDLARLQTALRRLIERHDMLRTIVLPDGRQQVLRTVPPYEIAVSDLRDLPAEIVERRLAQVRREMSHAVIEITRWPLFDFRASCLGEAHYRLHIGCDAILGDALSFLVLKRELALLYQNPAAQLPPLDLTFRDYVRFTAERRKAPSHAEARDYWLAELPLLPPPPDLPLSRDCEGPARFERRAARLDQQEWRALRVVAKEFGITPAAAVLASFVEVLARWSGSKEFTLNVTLFDRPPIHPQIHEVVGDFTSLTLLKCVNAGASFVERAQALQARLWNDLDHREFSGVSVLREMVRAGRSGSMPVVFTSTIGVADGDGVDPVEGFDQVCFSITQSSQVWIDHQVYEDHGALCINWDSLQGRFPERMLDDMIAAQQELLCRMATNRDVWSVNSIIPVPERQTVVRRGLEETRPVPDGAMLHTLFRDSALRHPGRTAVMEGGRAIGYGELLRYANQIGRVLRQLGVRPNQVVAIVMRKSWEQIAAALGILQAGAAYLPIDPELPEERIAYLLEQGEVRICLTAEEKTTLQLPGIACFSIHNAEICAADDSELEPVQTPGDLAYLIFTSGSTGQPKGVMIDHRGAVNTVLDLNERFHITGEDRILALSSLGFDLSVYDIFGALAAGATVVMPQAGRPDPAHWLTLVREQRITTWNSVPALMELFSAEAELHPAGPLPLRLVLLSGDWIPVALPDRVRAIAPSAEIISLGGATEASIWSIFFPIRSVPAAWTSIPYGKPLANQSVTVRNHALEPVPDWVPGELYIGGMGVALGYWRDPVRTRQSFLTDPATGARLYRTGDFGRYLPDGNIEFLGRRDSQIKIRGYRIELGEIEAVLSRHVGVDLAVADAVGDSNADRRLEAWIVSKSGASVDISELRSFAAARLPNYMVPASLTLVDRVPLTSNGKVDRRALRSSVVAPPAAAHADEQWWPGVEQTVGKILAGLMNGLRLGRHENFFHAGLNSLVLMQMIARLRDTLGIDVPLRTVYESPTIQGLGQAIEHLHADAAPAVSWPIRPAPRDGSAPLSFAQEQLLVVAGLAASESDYHVPCVVRIEGPLQTGILQQALTEVVRRHEILRTRLVYAGNSLAQQAAEPSEVVLSQLDLSAMRAGEREAEIGRMCREAFHRPFDLFAGPVLRCLLFRCGPREHVLALYIHHIACDALSIWRLLEEVKEIYGAAIAGRTPSLPSLRVQYADYAVWQRRTLVESVTSSHLAYWRETLADWKPLRLPRLTQSQTGPEGQMEMLILPEPLVRSLRQLAAQERRTLFAILLAAFEAVIASWTGAYDVAVATNVSGRSRPELEPLIGLFLNQVIVRNRLDRAWSFRDFLARVSKSAIEANAHSEVPFSRVIDALRLEQPLTPVKIDFQQASMDTLEMADLRLAPAGLVHAISREELVLQITDKGEQIAAALLFDSGNLSSAQARTLLELLRLSLEAVTAEPAIPIDRLLTVLAEEHQRAAREPAERMRQSRSRSLRSRLARGPSARTEPTELVHIGPLLEGAELPLIATPVVEGVDLLGWARAHREQIRQQLERHGGILFRGFLPEPEPDHVEQFLNAVCGASMEYRYRSTPRKQVSGNVYTSTEYPAGQSIPLHNELSYSRQWPLGIAFLSLTVAQRGGETPIADSRKIHAGIPKHIREEFERRKIMYVRNYGDGPDLAWQEVFGTADRDAVEAFCRESGIEWEWRGKNGLTTRQVCQAVAAHPRTNETVWFNQAHLFHISALPDNVAQSLLSQYGERGLPRNAYFGDGAAIPKALLDEIRAAMAREEIVFPWQRGDLLLLDNMLAAHGRRPFAGSRRVVVAMGEPVSSSLSGIAGAVNG